NHDIEVDLATAGHDHGVEFVTAQDRTDFGDGLPPRRSADALVTVQGTGSNHAQVDVLVLDEREYLFEPDPERAGPGRPTNIEVEDRLRRDVVDYLAYLRRQGQL